MADSPLRTWRKAAGLTQEDLAQQIGRSDVAVSRYETGTLPDKAALQKIIEITGGAVTANDWFAIPTPPPKGAPHGRTAKNRETWTSAKEQGEAGRGAPAGRGRR